MRIFACLEGKAKGGNLIMMKFYIGVAVHDVITHAHLGGDRFGGF